MFIIYDFIFLLISLFFLPIYIFRRKFHAGFIQRLGFLPRRANFKNPIWIHAVSVGEAVAMKGLIAELRAAFPGKQLVISTVTATGNTIAQGIARGDDFVTYLPLDLSLCVNAALSRVKPSICVIAETELWPNLISALYAQKIPVVIVNGRVSDNSFRGYLRIRWFISAILRKISLFCVQTQRDKERLRALGAPVELIQVTGNVKFDLISSTEIDRVGVRAKIDLKPGEKLLLAASTHPGEEEILLDVFTELLKTEKQLRMLIVPRHPERAQAVAELCRKNGFKAQKISEFAPPKNPCNCPEPVLVLDTVGELMNYYAVCDIAFVGGSLVEKGGHNIIEPAANAVPIIIGPHMFNFRDIAGLFVENDACVQVRDAEGLLRAVQDLLNNPSRCAELGKNAQGLLEKNRGATARTAALLRQLL